MSDTSPVSFVDDGLDLEQHPPRGNGRAFAKPAEDNAELASTTGSLWSYIDDGADFLLPEAESPRFGDTSPNHCNQLQRKEQSKKYHADYRKAVAGDINNTLAHMRALGRLDTKSTTEPRHDARMSKRSPKQEGVKIRLPKPPPNYVIRGEGERVVVVDDEGEVIDSGSPGPSLPQRLVLKRSESLGFYKSRQEHCHSSTSSTRSRRERKDEGDKAALGRGCDVFKSGGMGPALSSASDDSWSDCSEGGAHDAASNYRAPTVEDDPGTPYENDGWG